MSPAAYYLVGMDEMRVGVSTGGGGYGRPDQRDADQVRSDVINGILTREAADREFGVVLRGEGLGLELDEQATLARRAELAKLERPIVDPTTPGASTWVEDAMVRGDEYFLNPRTI
jgi:hypothetical protein